MAMQKTILYLLFLTALAAMAVERQTRAAEPTKRVVVMYFHRTQRCPTCQTMGTYTEEAVKTRLAKEVKDGSVSLHFINFEDPQNARFTQAYGVTGPTLIVAKAAGGKAAEFVNLKEIWVKVRDKEAFLDYVESNARAYLR